MRASTAVACRGALVVVVVALALGVAACDDEASAPTQAFGSPIDFTYACEGDGATAPPDNLETDAFLSQTRMCADVPALIGGTFQDAEGVLVGAVLSRSPPRVHLVQMNPNTRLSLGVLDTDDFIPGFTGIPVGLAPLRILRQSDWGAFYVVSAGDQDVTRIVVKTVQGEGGLDVETARFELPDVPSDALIHGDSLVVASARAQQLWIFDLASSPEDPPVVAVDLDGIVHSMQPLGDDVLVTWEDRPIVTRLSLTSSERTDAGIRHACSDTLDNDGDGLADAADPDCRDGSDPSEAGPLTARPSAELAAITGFPSGVHSCGDGLDNDRDGLTDTDDPSCIDADSDGEDLPACNDGLDNDLDGLTDTDDESCYGAFDLSEGQLGPFGPYQATVVNAAPYGLFVYVMDTERKRLVVLDADNGLARVSATRHAADVPAVAYEKFSNPGEVFDEDVLPGLRKVPFYGSHFQGRTDLRLTGGLGNTLSAGRLRGELWGRLIEPDADGVVSVARSTLNTSQLWAPPGCDPERSTADVCVMPGEDDATWYVFIATMEGRIQLIEVVRRGVVMHRHAQDIEDVDLRGSVAGRPSLTLRGERMSVGSSLPERLPFLGPLTEELLVERVEDVSPRKYRQYGVWGHDDPEGVESETWEITYEGELPGAAGALGRFISPITFYDPASQFCTDGVEPGDWLVLAAAPDTLVASLRQVLPVELTDADGVVTAVCPVEPAETAEIEVKVVTVGQTSLVIDPATARLRPVPPVLDEDAIEADGTVSTSECEDALEELKLTLTYEANLPATDAFAVGNLPRHMSYSVRAASVWTVVGTRSGYLHRNVWDAADGRCVLDGKTPDWPEPATPVDPGEGADEEAVATYEAELAALTAWQVHEGSYSGRLAQLGDEGTGTTVSYGACTPILEEIDADGAALFHPDPDNPVRFHNFSFELEVFPGCIPSEDGSATLVESQRDTRWTFQVAGPESPRAATVAGVLHSARVPVLDFRRQQMQLDTAGRQVHQLEIRADGADHLATYD